MTRTREGDTLLDADSAEELAATQRAILNVLEDFGDEKTELRSVRKALLNVLEDFGFEKAVLEDAQRALLNILDDFENENQKVQQANADLRRTEEKFRSQKRQAHGYGSWLVSGARSSGPSGRPSTPTPARSNPSAQSPGVREPDGSNLNSRRARFLPFPQSVAPRRSTSRGGSRRRGVRARTLNQSGSVRMARSSSFRSITRPTSTTLPPCAIRKRTR